MRRLLIIAIAATITGCATSGRSPELGDTSNLSFEKDSNGNEFIVAAKFSYKVDKPIEKDTLPLCVSEVVENRPIAIQGTASVVGTYTGRVYSQATNTSIGGGQVLRYVSDDRKNVMADGAVTYIGFMNTDRNVRFSLTTKTEGMDLNLTFGNLEQVQIATGVTSNDGYHKLGSWTGASPAQAISKLKSIADNLYRCVSR